MKSAIIPTVITQNIYDMANNSDDYFAKGSFNSGIINYYIREYKGVETSPKHVFVLDIEDIVDYLGKDNLVQQEVNKMFFNNVTSNEDVWLRSARYEIPPHAFRIRGQYGEIGTRTILEPRSAQPAFFIKLGSVNGGVDFTFEDETPAQYSINTYTNNSAWGSVTGGGQYDKNTTITLTATASEHYAICQYYRMICLIIFMRW